MPDLSIALLALRLFWREWRAGESRLLFIAVMLAAAAVASVSFLADRVARSLVTEASQLIGADLVLIADHPLPPGWLESAGRHHLRAAQAQTFPSMVVHGGRTQLVEVKAVDAAYPLLGRLGVAGGGEAGRPAGGAVWPDERLAQVLDLAVGTPLGLGQLPLRVGAILTREPDRGMGFFGLAPRLMMSLDDVAATRLLQAGSRATYRLLLAGADRDVAAFREEWASRLGRGERMEDIEHARPELRLPLARAERFLRLTILLALLLAGVAVFLAARRYQSRHRDNCAILRSLGASQARITGLYGLQLLWLALLAGGFGSMVGYGLHLLLVQSLSGLLAGMVGAALPAPSAWPFLLGMGVAASLVLGFALPNVIRLRDVPALRVLRQGGDEQVAGGWAEVVAGIVVFAVLSMVLLGQWQLGLASALGLLCLLALMGGAARLGVGLLARWLRARAGSWGWVGASLSRQMHLASVQIPALALGMTAIMLLTVTRGDLMAAWERALPLDAPNRFVLNILPDERDAFSRYLAAAGIAAELSPMVRGRLQSINDTQASAARYPDNERAQRLVEREFNLSWRAGLPAGNLVSGGRWFSPADQGQALASVEEGLAATLGIRVGDQVRFMIEGSELRLRVVGLRKLEWESMRANFFILTPPGVLDQAPATYLGNFYLPPEQQGIAPSLLRQFPGISIIDLAAVMAEVRHLLDQLALALQWVFAMSLLAGMTVLAAALQATIETRRYEIAIMRALGAPRSRLRRALLGELFVVGALAGLLAGLVSSVLAPVLVQQLFSLEMAFHGLPILLAMLAGGGLCLIAGWGVLAGLLKTAPMETLRRG